MRTGLRSSPRAIDPRGSSVSAPWNWRKLPAAGVIQVGLYCCCWPATIKRVKICRPLEGLKAVIGMFICYLTDALYHRNSSASRPYNHLARWNVDHAMTWGIKTLHLDHPMILLTVSLTSVWLTIKPTGNLKPVNTEQLTIAILMFYDVVEIVC